MDGFGPTLRQLRRRGGLSLRELARLTNYDFGYLGQIERGDRSPNRRLAEACDRALHTDGALLEAYTLNEEADQMRRRAVLHTLTALAFGASAPPVALEALRHGLSADADQDEWQSIAVDYARDFYTTPPADLLDQLGTDLTVLQHLMAVRPDADLRRTAGQLSVVMAMTLASTGQLTLARRWWRTARRHADESADLDTRIWVRDWEVVNGTYENRPVPQILALADETVALAGGHVCSGTAGVLSGRAQALAAAGRTDDAAAALRDVAEITERMPAPIMADAESMFGWPEVRLRHTESYVYTYIGDTARATAAQDQALALYPVDLERERAQLQMHRASCLIQDGHIADGLRYAADVLDSLPADRHNALLYDVARRVVSAVPQKERARAEVDDLRDRIAALPSG